jgi:hypothetical protein
VFSNSFPFSDTLIACILNYDIVSEVSKKLLIFKKSFYLIFCVIQFVWSVLLFSGQSHFIFFFSLKLLIFPRTRLPSSVFLLPVLQSRKCLQAEIQSNYSAYTPGCLLPESDGLLFIQPLSCWREWKTLVLVSPSWPEAQVSCCCFSLSAWLICWFQLCNWLV